MANEWEEIPQSEYDSAHKSYMNSREGFLSNLTQAAKQRATNVATLGNAQQQEPPAAVGLGGQLGALMGRAAVDVPAMFGAGALGAAGIPALLGYGYATSPGQSSAERLGDALSTGVPLKVGRSQPVSSNRQLPSGGRVFEGEVVNPEGGAPSYTGMGGLPTYDELVANFENIRDTVSRPGQIEEEIQALRPEKQAADLMQREGKEAITSQLDESIGDKNELISQAEESIDNILGDRSDEGLRSNVANAMQGVEQDINKQNQANYNDFEQKYGDILIDNPIDFRGLGRDFGLSNTVVNRYPELKPIINRLKPSESIGTNLGIPQEVTHTVQDYLQLFRTLRDLSKENRDQSFRAIGAEKAQLLSDKKAFDALNQEVKRLKIDALDDDGRSDFQNAQDYYKSHVVPLREHAPTKSIIKQGKVPNNYFDALNQPGVEAFRDTVINNPGARQAIANHSLLGRDLTSMSPDALAKLIASDAGKLLSDDLRKALSDYAKHKLDLAGLNKIKSASLSPRVKSTDAAMKALFEAHPEYEKPFKDLKDVMARMKKIERELIQKGLDKREAEEAAAKYFKILTTVKTVKSVKSAIKRAFRF